MRLLVGLRWRKAGARMAVVLISLATLMLLLGGCWEVAAPLIGVGAVGGGVVVATSGVGTKPGSSPTKTQQGGGASVASLN